MDHSNPVILGFDVATPLGENIELTWQNALEGRSGISRLTRFKSSPEFPVICAGELNYLTCQDVFSPAVHPSLRAVERALLKSGIPFDHKMRTRVGVTFSSSIGGLASFIHSTQENDLVSKCGPIHLPAWEISKKFQFQGPLSSPVGACATGNLSIALGAMWIKQGLCDVVVCGASDFPLIETLVEAFSTMNAAFKRPADADRAFNHISCSSRPFSCDRKGMVLSEGIGVIILASKKFAVSLGIEAKLEVAGYAMNSDAHHFVSPHLPSIKHCMEMAIAQAGIAACDIDYVNAHAASTKVGDLIEAQAILEIFGTGSPPISSNKSQLGHAMGASSAIESVLSCMSLLEGKILPNLNLLVDPEVKLDTIVEAVTRADLTYVLNNSFGFGGCNCCLVLKKIG